MVCDAQNWIVCTQMPRYALLHQPFVFGDLKLFEPITMWSPIAQRDRGNAHGAIMANLDRGR